LKGFTTWKEILSLYTATWINHQGETKETLADLALQAEPVKELFVSLFDLNPFERMLLKHALVLRSMHLVRNFSPPFLQTPLTDYL